MAADTLSEMPQAFGGNRNYSILHYAGPASYTSVVPGTPPAGPTGGQTIDATRFGLKYIEFIMGGMDESGTYLVFAAAGNPATAQTYTLIWITANTGAQVAATTNLSTFKVRLTAIGR